MVIKKAAQKLITFLASKINDSAKTIRGSRFLRERIAVIDDHYSWTTNPSTGMDPYSLGELLRNAQDGDIGAQMDLFEEIEEKDLHITSCLNDRKLALANKTHIITPTGESAKEKEIASYCEWLLEEISNWEDAKYDILDSIGKGLSLSEIMWNIKGGKIIIETIDWVQPNRILVAKNGRDIRLLTKSEPVYGIELPENKFIVHKTKAKSGNPARSSILRICAWAWLIKTFDTKAWVQFAEGYGHPLKLAKYGPGAGEAEKSVLRLALKELGLNASGIIPNDAAIEFVKADVAANSQLFKDLFELMNREISKGIVGATLTKDVENTGAYSASKTHAEVKDEIVQSDAIFFNKTIREQVFRPAVKMQFGPDALPPWYTTFLEKKRNQKEFMEMIEIAVRTGTKIPLHYPNEELNIPIPGKNEPILVIKENSALPFKSETKVFSAASVPEDNADKKTEKEKRIVEQRNSLDYKIDEKYWNARSILAPYFSEIEKDLGKFTSFDEAIEYIENKKISLQPYLELGKLAEQSFRESFIQGSLDAKILAKVFSANTQVNNDYRVIPENMERFLKVYSYEIAHIEFKVANENIKGVFEKAIKDGYTYQDFYESIKEFPGISRLTNNHLQTVFYTNMTSVYMGGKYWEYQKAEYVEEFPYFRYVTMDDGDVRDSHRKMHNKVFRRDDKIWDIWWPPNGFRCRCDVEMVTYAEAVANGWEVLESAEEWLKANQPAFSGNQAKPEFIYNKAKELEARHGISLEKTYKDFDFSKIEQTAGEPIERKLKKDSKITKEEFKKSFEMDGDKKEISDYTGDKIIIKESIYNKFAKDNNLYRLSEIEYLEPTLKRPGEVWGEMSFIPKTIEVEGKKIKVDYIANRKKYIKRFVEDDKNNNFLIIVEMENNEIVTWYKVDKNIKIDNRRKGYLLYMK